MAGRFAVLSSTGPDGLATVYLFDKHRPGETAQACVQLVQGRVSDGHGITGKKHTLAIQNDGSMPVLLRLDSQTDQDQWRSRLDQAFPVSAHRGSG